VGGGQSFRSFSRRNEENRPHRRAERKEKKKKKKRREGKDAKVRQSATTKILLYTTAGLITWEGGRKGGGEKKGKKKKERRGKGGRVIEVFAVPFLTLPKSPWEKKRKEKGRKGEGVAGLARIELLRRSHFLPPFLRSSSTRESLTGDLRKKNRGEGGMGKKKEKREGGRKEGEKKRTVFITFLLL